ncbi:type I restriction-modification system subunit M [Mucilaginibacter gilvus]|uniref:site-specific DNA-methyltransferase (adenine-specific) n=1 Tax=Mucilaginibacter gilvus TaxID=2305909 RepID=A0A444MJD2_9SPHI|nr:type I restriction-modification system subunit M [Mucilaginibacter gilvus]RWY48180.1 type I restriction-modification system subunit M [Mucilaginibacter gilvus]
MNKQQLAAKIWESANQMRSKIEANEYKDYILGFIFYKYLSEYEIKFAKKEKFTDEDIKLLSEEEPETVDYLKENIGYFIAYKDLFSTWIDKGSDFEVSDVRDALSAFNRLFNPAYKKLFDGIFKTLETGLSKLGDTAALQTKAISELIQLIKDIPMDGRQDYDVLGFIYEYLIEKFAANAGKKAGEFYTPHEVSVLMSEIIAHHLKDRSEIQIYDPTSGSGSLLINIGKSVAKHMDGHNKIKYYAQELKQNTYNLTRMNLIMRGINIDNIETRNGDTLEEDWPYFNESDPVNSYNPLYLDAVVSNPPYSQKWEPADKEADPRYARFGMAPKSKADFAFLLHDLFHLKPDGIMTIVLPHGVLFRGGEEGAIRKNLIEQNHIDAIIGLPANIFFGTGIPTTVMVLKQKRVETDILIIDASKRFIKEGKNNKLRASDIRRIADAVIERQSIPKLAALVSRDEIRKNDYNLNIPRYVDSGEAAESWDIYATMFGGIPVKEIDELSVYWEAFPGLKESVFTNTTDEIAALKIEDLTSAINTHTDVKAFLASFNHAFANFDTILKSRLIEKMLTLSIAKEKSILSADIFSRLQPISLIDRYAAYQLLDDAWQGIAGDLEMLQTEGFEAAKQVDANMVTKKVKGKDTEVQDGWKGHILPFELVQQLHLADELQSLIAKENRLAEITAKFEELLEALSEEVKDSDITNEAKDAFVNAEIIKASKDIAADKKKGIKYSEDDDETKIWKVNTLIVEEKALKKEINEEAYALHILTKKTIETLTDEQVNDLLEHKWINPLVNALHNLPANSIATLTQKVNYLAGKYSTTLQQVSNQLQDTEQALAQMMGELTGSVHDMQGLNEWQKLLQGEDDDSN